MRITACFAAGGALIGAAIGLVRHLLVWRPSGPIGWSSYGSPRRYTDYLATGSGPDATVRLHLATSGGWQAAWWPLLPATFATGLIIGALIGAVVLIYRSRLRPGTGR